MLVLWFTKSRLSADCWFLACLECSDVDVNLNPAVLRYSLTRAAAAPLAVAVTAAADVLYEAICAAALVFGLALGLSLLRGCGLGVAVE